MSGIDYYPFERDISLLEIDDLKKLQDVPENWYIEYKQSTTAREKIAKEMCAFANRHGGYIFIGIAEKNGSNGVAENFLGVEPGKIQEDSHTIELAATVDCRPAVLYQLDFIHSTKNSLGMPVDNKIIVITIPPSENTPHVHSSGVIYQRTGTKVMPVIDAAQLSALLERREKHFLNIKQKLTRRLELHSGIQNNPFLFVNIVPKTKQNEWINVDFETLNKYIEQSQDLGLSVPLERCEYIHMGKRFSQRDINHPIYPPLALNLFNDGSVRFDIPLSISQVSSSRGLVTSGEKLELMRQICRSQNIPTETNIVDYGHIFMCVTSMFTTYFYLLEQLGLKDQFYVGIELINVGYTVPFFPVDGFLQTCIDKGVPFNYQNEICHPVNYNQDSLRTSLFDPRTFPMELDGVFKNNPNNKQMPTAFNWGLAVSSIKILPHLITVSGSSDLITFTGQMFSIISAQSGIKSKDSGGS